MTPEELKDADEDLMNWGRCYHDRPWLNTILLIDPPPTSNGYIAPVRAYDEPEPVKPPIDELNAIRAEHVIRSMKSEPGGRDIYDALVVWYSRLVFLQCTQDERYAILSKKLHCAYPVSRIILVNSQTSYWQAKLVLDQLHKFARMDAGVVVPNKSHQ